MLCMSHLFADDVMPTYDTGAGMYVHFVISKRRKQKFRVDSKIVERDGEEREERRELLSLLDYLHSARTHRAPDT